MTTLINYTRRKEIDGRTRNHYSPKHFPILNEIQSFPRSFNTSQDYCQVMIHCGEEYNDPAGCLPMWVLVNDHRMNFLLMLVIPDTMNGNILEFLEFQ